MVSGVRSSCDASATNACWRLNCLLDRHQRPVGQERGADKRQQQPDASAQQQDQQEPLLGFALGRQALTDHEHRRLAPGSGNPWT